MADPNYLYHYTSLETLALILKNRSLCFNNLLYVDDVEEAESKDMGRFGKYINVSCWTDDAEEQIALWNLYTPNMHGVRIKMPVFPFRKYHYRAGEYYLTEDVDTYINMENLFREDTGAIVCEFPKLVQVKYTDDEAELFPIVKHAVPENAAEIFMNAHSLSEISNIKVDYSFDKLGEYKRSVWSFQHEWRYIIKSSPLKMHEMERNNSFEYHKEIIRRLENEHYPEPYQRLFLELDDDAVKQMEVVFGPRMTDAEKILAEGLLKAHGLENKWQESSLRIR